MKSYTLAIEIGLLLLAGCAAIGPKDFSTANGRVGTYFEQKLDETHYIVRLDGNDNSTDARVWYVWIYRCAQLARKNGYDAFVLEDDESQPQQHRERPGEPSLSSIRHPYINAASSSDHPIFQKVRSSGQPFFIIIPGHSYGAISPAHWHSHAIVALYQLPLPPDTPIALNTQYILDQLNPYIKSGGTELLPNRYEFLKRAAIPSPAAIRNAPAA